MAKQSKPQQDTVGRVMHEFKHGELETRGRKVTNPKQAIAIALHEAGASNQETTAANRRNLRRTKAKEHQGKTVAQKAGTRQGARDEPTRAELYERARRQDIPGRSRMSKDELRRALR